MFIKSAEITSYKSFRHSAEIEFESGINLLVGINNSGKTALLEALGQFIGSHQFAGPNSEPSVPSQVLIKYRIPFEEVLASSDDNHNILIPRFTNDARNGVQLLECARGRYVDLTYRKLPGQGEPVCLNYSFEDRQLIAGPDVHIIRVGPNATLTDSGSGPRQNYPVISLEVKAKSFANNTFSFSGERMKLHSYPLDTSRVLKPDASNLPAVLSNLADDNATRFRDDYLKLVSRVLPNVKSVKTNVDSERLVHISLSPEEQTAKGQNIGFALEQSGTGVGQVLAILCAVEYSEASVIIIDEPNSFLHPSATRELLRIFRENEQHQYFISTHAPEVFSELKPAFYNSLSYNNYETAVERRKFGQLARDYEGLGISPFYERTLWVEGPTETAALPAVMRDSGLQIHELFATADMVAKGRLCKEVDRIVEVYEKMVDSQLGGSPQRSKMKIMLDGDMTPQKRTDYEKRPSDIVHFLPRKMFESYLLNASAIAEILSETVEESVSEGEIQVAIDSARGALEEEEWLKAVDAVKLLEKIFSTHAACYRKTEHSVAIARKIVNDNPNHFDGLRDFVKALFETKVS